MTVQRALLTLIGIAAAIGCCPAQAEDGLLPTNLRLGGPDLSASPARAATEVVKRESIARSGLDGCGRDGLALDAARGAAASAPGSRTGALFRSLLVPGYGQMYNGQSTKGTIVLGAEVALLSTALAFHVAGDSVFTAYGREARSQVGTDPTGRLQRMLDSAQQRYQVRDVLLLAATGLWGMNVVDAYLSGGRGAAAEGESSSDEGGLAPLAAIRPGQAILGLQGQF